MIAAAAIIATATAAATMTARATQDARPPALVFAAAAILVAWNW